MIEKILQQTLLRFKKLHNKLYVVTLETINWKQIGNNCKKTFCKSMQKSYISYCSGLARIVGSITLRHFGQLLYSTIN